MPIIVFRLQQVLALFTPLTDTALVLESQNTPNTANKRRIF